MKRIPKTVTEIIREALAKAWEEGYNQGKAEGVVGRGMGDYGGPLHCNPYIY